MSMNRRTALAGLGALAAATATRARAADLTPLALGTMPTDGSAQPFYGIEKNFFRDNGFDVQLSLLNNTASLAAAVASGSLAIGFGSVIPLAQAHLRGLEFRVIAPATIYSGGAPVNTIVVGKDAPYKTGKDLNNQVVAVNGLRDLSQYEMQAWLEQNGADLKTIRLIETPFSEMGAALQTGRIAAGITAEPFATAAASVTRVIGNASEAVAHRYMVTGWFAEAAWLAKNGELAHRLQIALQQSAKYGNTNHQQTEAILAKYTKISPEVASKMARSVYGETKPDPALIQPVLDLATKYGAFAPMSASELIWNG